jgi:hypothetical protein
MRAKYRLEGRRMVTKRISSLVFFLLLAVCATASLFPATSAWAQAAGNQQVDLSSAFNQAGLFDNGVTFTNGGMDGGGAAYSAQQLGLTPTTPPTITSNGVLFNFGPVNTTSGTLVNDVINLSPGVTVTLPANQQDLYSTMIMLGVAVQGSHTAMVTVNYTTGAPDTFNQTMSDWCGFGGFSNESEAISGIDRIFSDGTLSSVPCNVYAYTYPLDFTRAVQSITLTNTDNTLFTFALAITLKPPSYTIAVGAATPASVSAGSSATAAVTVDPQPGYSGTVTLACSFSPNIPTNSATVAPACSVSPTSLPVASGSTSPATVSFTPAAPASAVMFQNRRMFYAFWLPIPGLSLVGLGLGSSGARRRKLLGLLALGMVLAGLIVTPACISRTKLGNVGTPPGSYTVTITGSDTNALTQASNAPGTSNSTVINVQ